MKTANESGYYCPGFDTEKVSAKSTAGVLPPHERRHTSNRVPSNHVKPSAVSEVLAERKNKGGADPYPKRSDRNLYVLPSLEQEDFPAVGSTVRKEVLLGGELKKNEIDPESAKLRMQHLRLFGEIAHELGVPVRPGEPNSKITFPLPDVRNADVSNLDAAGCGERFSSILEGAMKKRYGLMRDLMETKKLLAQRNQQRLMTKSLLQEKEAAAKAEMRQMPNRFVWAAKEFVRGAPMKSVLFGKAYQQAVQTASADIVTTKRSLAVCERDIQVAQANIKALRKEVQEFDRHLRQGVLPAASAKEFFEQFRGMTYSRADELFDSVKHMKKVFSRYSIPEDKVESHLRYDVLRDLVGSLEQQYKRKGLEVSVTDTDSGMVLQRKNSDGSIATLRLHRHRPGKCELYLNDSSKRLGSGWNDDLAGICGAFMSGVEAFYREERECARWRVLSADLK